MEKNIAEFMFLEDDSKNLNDLFKNYAKIAAEQGIVNDQKSLIKAFKCREAESSTGFEDGFAIPHARAACVLKPAIFFIKNQHGLEWESIDGQSIKYIIMLLVPEVSGDYLDILSNIATNLMDQKIREKLKTSSDHQEIFASLNLHKSPKPAKTFAKAPLIVGITACATGVAHTYMARDAILAAAAEIGANVFVETQGQKGQEYTLTPEQIAAADVVILATDIAVDTERFSGKRVFNIGTKKIMSDPVNFLKTALSGAGKQGEGSTETDIFDVKDKKAWIRHIMSGVSFMIPFIVFAGIIFALVTGIGKMIYGTWLDLSGSFDNSSLTYTQVNVILGVGQAPTTKVIEGVGIAILFYLNQFAAIGFTVMIPFMGAYIANSIAGRSAITPAFILTWAGTNPNLWFKFGVFAEKEALFPGNGGGIFAALLFGFVIGYTIKWINTKWKINKYIKPIMPIIIIPVFVSLFYGLIVIFLLGNIFGLIMGYVNLGLQKLEENAVGMAGLGLLLGLLAGIDMGGPINKIASFGATALIFVDGGKAMGAAAASFAIAPLGCGISTMIFREKFKKDHELGVNATILGFMGISEGAIPFAAKYTWAAIVPNIIGSGLAGMFAGIFQVSGWVGAWGGPIIAIFGGVTTWDMSYLGILWYFLAIIIGTAVHIVLFRIFVEIQTKGKLTGTDFKNMFTRTKKVQPTKVNDKVKK
ncbi:PTS system fructose-specific IIA component [Spiroplasma clarkii]|uniref:PTS system, fructose-specific IIA component n=1 Tax=Spiroplasma clarkii TaxID=2139 RepID=A0A1Y0KZV6_9MOLU|nr:fructose PTS transporter subunit IIA [Spiroplasma clarkii]ARU91277.1 PTS system fructose-specific IIA component [Spiroplasma clarkii]ATX70715.1 PTS system, fructose-specific IIA component [Spiroplasma clarkii]